MAGFLSNASRSTSVSSRTGDGSGSPFALSVCRAALDASAPCATAGRASEITRRKTPILLINHSRHVKKEDVTRRIAPERRRHYEEGSDQKGTKRRLRGAVIR